MTYWTFRTQENPDGKVGHEERERLHARQKKVDVKRAKRKFTGLRKRWQERKMRVTKQADPKTLILPTACPCYQPGCTYHNCDGCKTKRKYDKEHSHDGK